MDNISAKIAREVIDMHITLNDMLRNQNRSAFYSLSLWEKENIRLLDRYSGFIYNEMRHVQR